jgi:hypothetical protein
MAAAPIFWILLGRKVHLHQYLTIRDKGRKYLADDRIFAGIATLRAREGEYV